MLQLLVLLISMFWAQPAEAQSFPKPPDVPSYVSVEPTYRAGTLVNRIGNGVNPDGGTPPAMANELADIPTPNRSAWIYPGTYGETNGYKAAPADGGTATEMKFRTSANATHILYDDPIRNYGQPGTSHCHLFFGNPSVNAYSTFPTIRQQSLRSLAAGGGLNGSGYWLTCPTIENAFGDGKNYVPKPDYVIIYYQEDLTMRGKIRAMPRGLRYVTGFDMDAGYAWLQSKIDAANAQPGTAGRYQITNGAVRSFGTDYQCTNAAGAVVDQKSSTEELTNCPTDGQLIVSFSGARCWDGRNLWSPGGYKHVIPQIWDTLLGEWVCPDQYYIIASLQTKVFFSHEGVGGTRGINNWKWSCDAMGATLYGPGYKRGYCYHTDYMYGWDGRTGTTWQENGLGANGKPPHEMDSSVISATEGLLYSSGAPTGRNPQVNLNNRFVTSSPSNMFLLPLSIELQHGIDILMGTCSNAHMLHGSTFLETLTVEG